MSDVFLQEAGQNNCTKSGKTSQVTEAITNLEIVQQLLLNYLHDSATVDDLHLFTLWHITSYPDVGLKYFEKLAERIKDTGVSVQKRSIKIIRDMFTSNANFSEFTTTCVEIISRVNDEKSSVQEFDRYPDEEAGELSMAFVVRRPQSTVNKEQVIDFISKQVHAMTICTSLVSLAATPVSRSLSPFQVF
ncbi:hypothetical protein BC332_03559 [Capsicum chinense]|nr:hypothetical protein BC332_03559 [Capsicum chinense]